MKIKKKIIDVYMEGDEFTKPRIFWDYGEGINAYTLIGILEDIKQELIKEIDCRSEEDEK